jgi:FkbM family methyltransferase
MIETKYETKEIEITSSKSLNEKFVTPSVSALVRCETTDEYVYQEIFKKNTYRKLDIQRGDVVLDLGLNIGAFTLYAIKSGASVIYSYEPCPENFALAKHNIGMNFPICLYEENLFNKAVIGNNDKTRPFSINVKRNKGGHSLVEKRGRDTINVECENFNYILRDIKPDVIKMDIEGGEYELLTHVDHNLLKGVRELILEFHHAHLNDIESRDKYTEVINVLKKCFYNVDYKEHTKKAWVTIVHCWQW